MNLEARLAAVEAENDDLRHRVGQLEEALGMRLVLPIELGLTGHESALVGFLLTREIATKEALLSTMYGHRPDQDEPQIKIIDVFVCKARKKLKRFGLEIETVWGHGYRMSPETKQRIAAMLAAAAQSVITEPPALKENAA